MIQWWWSGTSGRRIPAHSSLLGIKAQFMQLMWTQQEMWLLQPQAIEPFDSGRIVLRVTPRSWRATLDLSRTSVSLVMVNCSSQVQMTRLLSFGMWKRENFWARSQLTRIGSNHANSVLTPEPSCLAQMTQLSSSGTLKPAHTLPRSEITQEWSIRWNMSQLVLASLHVILRERSKSSMPGVRDYSSIMMLMMTQ